MSARRVPVIISLLAALAAPVARARAQELSLDEAVAAALRANPEIAVARLRGDSARAEQSIARAVPPLSLQAIPQVPYQYSASLPIDLGPQRLYRTRVANLGRSAAAADLDDTTRQLVFAVRQAFVSVLRADAQRGIAQEQRDTFRQLLAADSAACAPATSRSAT